MLIEITLPILGTFMMPMIIFAVGFIAIPATALLCLVVWLEAKPDKEGN
jgi:hypothetical protein